MKRALAIVAGVLLLLVVGLWIGFRVWLNQQPPETRIAVAAMSTLEFLEAVRFAYAPPEADDNAAYGRREYAGRGHSPWVMRSSVDGRPRMLSAALAPGLWLAYSTETASIHQLWQGELDFRGPVFDAGHGTEPMSRGLAYLRAPTPTAWRVREGGAWQPARVRWRGHGFDPGTGALWLHFELSDSAGRSRSVRERPERIADGERLGLERRLHVESGPGPALALALDPDSGELELDGARLEAGGLVALEPGAARLVHWFGAPTLALERDAELEPGADAFAAHDCGTCHNARERAVGPAWSEIALRYRGMNVSATAAQLGRRIVEGGAGQWGEVPMPAHAELSREQAEALARVVLATEPAEAPTREAEAAHAGVATSWSFESEPRPASLHPSLEATPIALPGFTPQVGGLALAPDGSLLVATWDRDGALFRVEGWDGPARGLAVTRIAEGLHEPLGLAVADGAIFVMQKQEITQLVDSDADGLIDEYRTLANDWSASSNFHEFGFGLVPLGRHLYGALSVCVVAGGKSCRLQVPNRGTLFRASLETGEVEFVASGFRTPNGIAATPAGELLVTDNQGDWLPASKLVRARPGDDFGWRAPGELPDPAAVAPPALWLPQNEVGNSPTQPLVLSQGPYAGHVVFGDIYNGGLKRAWLEEVDGVLQGAAFHFSGGLQAPVHRLLEAPDGSIVVGQVGSRGNWGEPDKQWYGLERLRFGPEPAFEPLEVEARPDGFDVTLSRPLAEGLAPGPEHFALRHWYYVPSPEYGGPKFDPADLRVLRVDLSPDRRKLSLHVEGLAAGRVVYLHFDRALRSEAGETLWVNEAWYTLNALPARDAEGPPPNTLSERERAAGWQLLFDGESFAGWKNYGGARGAVEGWRISNGSLEFTRDVSFAGLVWNHLNPFATAALDLMTERRFSSFELSVDWKISPGGNSGIFYLVPDEQAPLAWKYGLEMQVLDDERHSDGRKERCRAGDLYGVMAGARRVAKPAGEWNTALVRVDGDRIEHWLNGEKLFELIRGSPEWQRAIAASGFADTPGFGMARQGHIVLQDHGDPVWYRNLKLRELPER